jgi:hypothetical protein
MWNKLETKKEIYAIENYTITCREKGNQKLNLLYTLVRHTHFFMVAHNMM